ncbi:MAG: peptide chain release factor N(5)-glutamine methyltransferase [Pseudomonadota bacterium]
MATIRSVLVNAVNRLCETSPSARLDAEVLIAHELDKNRSYLHAWPDENLTPDQALRIQTLVKKRAAGTPVAYLTGKKEFWSREFSVTPHVLIPRPETEGLVELALSIIPADERYRIADLGTGSGAIAITLAAERPNSHLVASDVSAHALEIAKANAAYHNANNVSFCLSNWFDAIPALSFDMITSNPPYIAENDPHLDQGDVRAEPRIALASSDHGLAALNTIAHQGKRRLKPAGYLLLEHGYGQSKALYDRLSELGYGNIAGHRDLQGHLRVTSAQRPF